MSNEMKNEQTGKDDSCCAKGSCCGKKFFALILGLLIFTLGFLVGKSNLCPMKICPFTQQK